MTTGLLIAAGAKALILAVCGLIATQVLPQWWMAARRRVALVAVMSLLLLPWMTLSLPEGMSAFSTLKVPQVQAHAWFATFVAGLWALGFLVRLCRLAVESHHLFRLARSGAPAGGSVLIVEGLSTPCMWGVVRPCIMMPATALGWNATQREAAMLHEEQHIRQHDGWHRIAAAIVRAVFWWNPFVHALCRRLEIESELCCDEAATVPTGRRAYGDMLLRLATTSCFENAPAWAAANSVRERIERLVAPKHCGRVAGTVRSLMFVAVVATGIIGGCCIDGLKKPSTDSELKSEAALRLSAEAFPLR